MKTLNAAAQTHLAQRVTTLAMCWRIERTDGVILAFTDYHDDLLIDGLTYQAASGMVRATAVNQQADLSVPDLEVETVFSSDAITHADMLAGRYDYADVTIFQVDYTAPEAFAIKLLRAKLGEVSIQRQDVGKAEIRGMTGLLKQRIGRSHETTCPYELGAASCGVDLAAFGQAVTVTAVTGNGQFATGLTQSDDWATHGKATFTGGANAGLSMEIKRQTGGALTLALPMPFPIAVGDAVTVYPGCDKRWKTCRDKFANQAFGGFPHIPGSDALYSVGTVTPA